MDLGWWFMVFYFLALTIGLASFIGYQLSKGYVPPRSRISPEKVGWLIVGPDYHDRQ